MSTPKKSKFDAGCIFQGRSCYRMGMKREECPHVRESVEFHSWQQGWDLEAQQTEVTV